MATLPGTPSFATSAAHAALSDITPTKDGDCNSLVKAASEESISMDLVCMPVSGMSKVGKSSQTSSFTCIKCQLSLPTSQMSMTRKNECVRDVASYMSLTKRWAKSRPLRAWWCRLKADEKVMWYRKQHQLTPGSKRTFDEISYQETARSSTGKEERDQDHFKPWKIFRDDALAAGRKLQDIEAEWRDAIENQSADCRWERGQWLVAEYRGLIVDRLRSDTQESSSTRSKRIETTDELAAFQQSGKAMHASYMEGYRGAHTPRDISREPRVDAAAGEHLVREQPLFQMETQIAREVNSKMKQEILKMSLANDDMMQAELCDDSTNQTNKSRAGESIGVEQVKVSSNISVQLAKLKQLQENATKTAEELKKSIDEHVKAPSDSEGGPGKLKVEVVTCLEEMKTECDTLKEGLQELEAEAEKAVSMNELKDVKAKLKEQEKQINRSEKVKAFKNKTKAITKLCETSARQAAVVAGGRIEEKKEPKSAQWQTYEGLYVTECHNAVYRCGSVFEAKSGYKAALVTPQSGDLVDKLESMAHIKSGFKSLQKHLEHNTHGVFSIIDPSKQKMVTKVLTKSLESLLLSTYPLPGSEWSAKVFVRQLYAAKEGFVNIGLPHMALMEMRILFSGSETLYGFAYDDVPGASLKDKRMWLMTQSAQKLHEKLSWAACHDSTKALVVPTGHLIVACYGECRGMRFSISSDDADKSRVRRMLNLLFESHRELASASSGYAPFCQFLDED